MTIREMRRIKEISQEEMAEHCGVHVNTYMRWEKNQNEIKLAYAKLIAEKLGANLEDIFLSSDTTDMSTHNGND